MNIDEKVLDCFPDVISARLYNDRVIMLVGEICEYDVENATRKIHTMVDSGEDILLLITSYGGSIEAGGAMIRTIRHAQTNGCKVIGEVRGYAMSMGCGILQACDLRFASPEDILMVHGSTSSSVGDIRNIEADVALAKNLMDIQAEFFANRNTSDDEKYHDKKYWRKLLDDNFPHYYFGREALELGLIDEVIN